MPLASGSLAVLKHGKRRHTRSRASATSVPANCTTCPPKCGLCLVAAAPHAGGSRCLTTHNKQARANWRPACSAHARIPDKHAGVYRPNSRQHAIRHLPSKPTTRDARHYLRRGHERPHPSRGCPKRPPYDEAEGTITSRGPAAIIHRAAVRSSHATASACHYTLQTQANPQREVLNEEPQPIQDGISRTSWTKGRSTAAGSMWRTEIESQPNSAARPLPRHPGKTLGDAHVHKAHERAQHRRAPQSRTQRCHHQPMQNQPVAVDTTHTTSPPNATGPVETDHHADSARSAPTRC